MTEKEIKEYLINKYHHTYFDVDDILEVIKNIGIKVSKKGLDALIEVWSKGYDAGYDAAYG